MRCRSASPRRIAADVGVMDGPWDGSDERHDNSEQHGVKGATNKVRRRSEREARQIEQETQDKQPNRKMNQERMQRMSQRFAFEKIFQHVDPTPVEDWRRLPRRFCAISFSTFARR